MYLVGYCVGNIIGTYFTPLAVSTFAILSLNRRPTFQRPSSFNPYLHLGTHFSPSTDTLPFRRPPNLPPLRRTPLRPRRNHHHLLLGRVPRRSLLHLLVEQADEPQERGTAGHGGLY